MPTPLPLRTPEPDAVARWLAGESPPEEAAVVSAWVDAEDSRRRTASGLKTLDVTKHSPELDIDALWCRLESELAARGTHPVCANDPLAAPETRRVPFWRRAKRGMRPLRETPIWDNRYVRSATTALAAVAIAVVTTVLVRSEQENDNPREIAPRNYATAAGERATVSLADGSVVRLGPQTTLRVAEHDVDVDGEALFTVTHQSRAPFVVRAGGTITRVLGTRFVVRKYSSDRAPRIIVADGRVSVGIIGKTDVAVLGAGMLATVTDSGTIEVMRHVVAREQTALIDGRLVFRDASLADIASELARAYGIEMRIVDATLAQRKITFTASVASESLVDVLDFLSTALDAHYTRAGRTVTFAPGTPALQRLRHSPFRSEPQYGR